MAWLTNQEKNRIEGIRIKIDAYRLDNYSKHTRAERADLGQKLLEVYQWCIAQGFNFPDIPSMMTYFFNLSNLYNVQELGFETMEAYEAGATQAQRDAYAAMWH
jgi:hypothetical protein